MVEEMDDVVRVSSRWARERLVAYRDEAEFKQLGRRPPELMWRAMSRCPVARRDAGGVQLEGRLLLLGGVVEGGGPYAFVDALEMRHGRWKDRWPLPEGWSGSRIAVAGDGERFAYAAAGAVAQAAAFDLFEGRWSGLPPLPRATASPAAALRWNRWHVLGSEGHWSLAVAGGQALEARWRVEPVLPSAALRPAAAVLEARLVVLTGGRTWLLEAGSEAWRSGTPPAVPVEEVESAIVARGSTAILVGGTSTGAPSDVVQTYDASADRWTLSGRMPYRSTAVVAGFHGDFLYFTTGQRDRGPGDPSPGELDPRTWRTRWP